MLKRTPGNVPKKKKIPLSFSRETQICQFLNRWCVRAHQFRCTWKLTVSQPCGDPGLPLLDHYQHGNRTGESSLKIIKSSSSPAAPFTVQCKGLKPMVESSTRTAAPPTTFGSDAFSL